MCTCHQQSSCYWNGVQSHSWWGTQSQHLFSFCFVSHMIQIWDLNGLSINFIPNGQFFFIKNILPSNVDATLSLMIYLDMQLHMCWWLVYYILFLKAKLIFLESFLAYLYMWNPWGIIYNYQDFFDSNLSFLCIPMSRVPTMLMMNQIFHARCNSLRSLKPHQGIERSFAPTKSEYDYTFILI